MERQHWCHCSCREKGRTFQQLSYVYAHTCARRPALDMAKVSIYRGGHSGPRAGAENLIFRFKYVEGAVLQASLRKSPAYPPHD